MDLIRRDEFINRPSFHKAIISPAMDETEKKRAEVFNLRHEKYSKDVEAFLCSYDQWMESHLRPINWRFITDSILAQADLKEKQDTKKSIQGKKKVLGEGIAEEIEMVRFLSSSLTSRMEDIYDLLTSKSKTAEDKASELERQYFLYDIVRVEATSAYYSFYDNRNYSLNYVDKTGCSVDIKTIFDELYDLAFPDDYRACQMFLEMHRLGLDFLVDPDGLTNADWGAYYCYQYIYRLFVEVDFNHHGTGSFPLFYLQQQKKPFLACVSVIEQALSRNLQQLLECSKGINQETYDKHRLTSHEFILAPIKTNIRNAGISKPKTPEENIRNMIFALGHSLDTVDLLCDHLAYLLESGDSLVASEREELSECYHQIQKLRNDIVYYTYSNSLVYQSAHTVNELNTIRSGEDLTRQGIEKQLQLCDHFRRISRLIHVEDFNLLMEEKRKLSEDIIECANTSSISAYTQSKLVETLDDVTLQLENELAERGLIGNFNKQIYTIFDKQNLSDANKLPDDLIRLLSSAEYLYHTYLDGQDESKLMDYSFIAILYYKALENLLDSQFYCPYIAPIKNKKIDSQKFAQYFDINSQTYFLKFEKVEKHLDLGTLSHMFSWPIYPPEMQAFIKAKFQYGAEEQFHKFGPILKEMATRRNKAAHGTAIIAYNDAIQARTDTFDADWELDAINCRGIIFDFIKLLR